MLASFQARATLAVTAGLVGILLTAGSATAAFPGANGDIAFARYPRNSSTFEEIYRINPNGGGLTRLTNSGGARVGNIYPDWSPSGRRIAYEHSSSSGEKIRVMTRNGGGVTSFGDASCRLGAGEPSWAPNGTTIAYVCRDPQNGDNIKTYDLSTHSRIQITPPASQDGDPEFSPTGDAIVFDRQLDNGASAEVVVARLNGTGHPTGEDVIAGNTTDEAALNPDWSPAADRLVYACEPINPYLDQDICEADVAPPHNETTLVGGGAGDQFPAFSPSGGKIVWDSGPEEGDTELKVKDLGTGTVTTLTSNQVVDEEADWGVG